ncbi:hypothetical protein QFC20_006224 [Naganishia adeliensis]|uniref:Uncharacterized protein n=1 Tax=Naganishia adeliensis TaxID=92952 RepID=A0ACC2VE72_9TREE|nr:hypothetical protein QFC20_006224 [Naganishia adeliensis]
MAPRVLGYIEGTLNDNHVVGNITTLVIPIVVWMFLSAKVTVSFGMWNEEEIVDKQGEGIGKVRRSLTGSEESCIDAL